MTIVFETPGGPPPPSDLRARLEKVIRGRGKALRDVGTLVSGVVAGRLIRVLTIPIIARLFDPNHFGQASFLIALATTLGAAATLRYAQALLLPGSADETRQLTRLCWGLIGVYVTLVTVGGALWPGSAMPAWLSTYDYWWIFLALMVAMLGISDVLHTWALRNRNFCWLAGADVVEGVSSASGRISWGAAFGSSVTGLLVPYVAALGLRTVVYAKATRPAARKPAPGRDTASIPPAAPDTAARGMPDTVAGSGSGTPHAAVTTGDLRAVAGRYSQFPLYGLPSALIHSLSQNIPLLVLGSLFTPSVVGLYAAADRLMRLPVRAISQGVRKVFAERAATRRRNGRSILPLLALTMAVQALAGVVPLGAIALFSEPLFAVLLGERWSGAGDYALPLALWGFSLFLLAPASATLMVLERQLHQLVMNLLRLVLFGIAVAIVVNLDLAPIHAVQLFALAGTASNFALVAIAFVMAARHGAPK